MNCLSLMSGFCASNCRNGAGGVAGIWMANKSDVLSISIDTSTASEYYNAVTDVSLGDGTWYYFEGFDQSSSFTEEIQASESSISYKQSLTLAIGSLDQSLRNTLEELGESSLVVVAEDNNGTRWFMGGIVNGTVKRGMMLMSGNSTSGTALSDRNGAELTFECQSPKPMTTVSRNGSLFSTLSGIVCDSSIGE